MLSLCGSKGSVIDMALNDAFLGLSTGDDCDTMKRPASTIAPPTTVDIPKIRRLITRKTF